MFGLCKIGASVLFKSLAVGLFFGFIFTFAFSLNVGLVVGLYCTTINLLGTLEEIKKKIKF